jgi:hypothetical protein
MMLSQPQESLAQLIDKKNDGYPGQDKSPLNQTKGGRIEYPLQKGDVHQESGTALSDDRGNLVFIDVEVDLVEHSLFVVPLFSATWSRR